MTNQTPPSPTEARAIETDVAAIEAAMRRLTLLAMTEQRKLVDADSNLPLLPEAEIGRIIANPIAEACHATWQKLLRLLAHIVGEQAAIDTQNWINEEMPALHPPTAKRDPFPSLARH